MFKLASLASLVVLALSIFIVIGSPTPAGESDREGQFEQCAYKCPEKDSDNWVLGGNWKENCNPLVCVYPAECKKDKSDVCKYDQWTGELIKDDNDSKCALHAIKVCDKSFEHGKR